MEWLRDVILIGFGYTYHTCFKHCIPHLIKLHWNHIIKNNFLPCSTTLVENSSLRVNWEQFVTDCEERASILGVWSEVDSAPPSPSIPTTGRKPAISPKSMDTHAERRSILSCEVVLTISLTELFVTVGTANRLVKSQQVLEQSISGPQFHKWVHNASDLSS